ncbi:MAG: DinB family protein, partial [Myxococcales bacterium]|nr:DinB family protein [Myxococcales bacterium]
MIETGYVRTMAAYNRWQNDHLFGIADGLDDAARRLERGAFFGSIHGTLNHILWADQVWMSRFTDGPMPPAKTPAESTGQHGEWQALRDARAAMDGELEAWAAKLDPAWLRADYRWFSGSQQREVSRPRSLLVAHMFNHQTHHR